MKKWLVKQHLIWIAICETVGLLSALLSMNGMKEYITSAIKPKLSPPPIVFPIVWTILFALMGIGVSRIQLQTPSKQKFTAINLFWAQLIFNFFWTLLFFNTKAYGFSFLWILILLSLIVFMTIQYSKIDKTAAYLQIPYILWVAFAAYLNYGVWMLN